MGEPNPLSEEVPPRLYKFSNEKDQFKWVWENAVSYSQPRSPAVVLFPFHKDIEAFVDFVAISQGFGHAPRRAAYRRGQGRVDPYQDINDFFSGKDSKALLQVLGNGSGSSAISISSSRKVIFLMTYHSAKGLDFDTVFVPSLDNGKKLYPGRELLNQDNDIENKLLFVALTRSKKFLFMSYVGDKPHQLIQALNIQITQQNSQQNTF
jgi:superfamily I DNA/RNA helicase